jgi:uroporphyrinogen III methyltransferase/synthase
VRGRELLERADVVVVDRLAPVSLLDHCREDAEIVHAGKVPHGEGMTQDEINAVLVDRAKAGLRVVRLKGGDPFVFGRGGEEAEACVKAKIPWEVVPGVTSAIAVPAYAGIPVTHRGVTQDVAIISGHVDPMAADSTVDWSALASGPRTLVLLMGVEKIGKIATKLVEHGRPGDTPVAMTRWGTTADQRTVVSTLDRIEVDAAEAKMTAPAVTVIGDVVRLRERLSWWESKPLFGLRVLVPRTRAQAGTMSAHIRDLGGTPVEVATIAIEPPRNPAPMQRAVTGLVSGRFAWVAFTSTNAVRAVFEQLDELGLDARVLAGVKIAAVGDATAEALRGWGVRPDLVPSKAMSSEELAREWPDYDEHTEFVDRVLLPRADIATETLVAGVKAKGWTVEEVTAYRTMRAPALDPAVRESIRSGEMDAVVFTSSSTAKNLLSLAGGLAESTLVAAIGPQTAAACRELGLRVDVEATTSTVSGVAQALADLVMTRVAETAATPVKAPAKVRSKAKPKTATK